MHCISVATFLNKIIISLRKLYIKASGILPGTFQTSFLLIRNSHQHICTQYKYSARQKLPLNNPGKKSPKHNQWLIFALDAIVSLTQAQLTTLPSSTPYSCWCTSPSYCISTAAAANSLQSCPTLCDPTDSSPPGSPIPGILQARTLEWVAISFSIYKSCLFFLKLS